MKLLRIVVFPFQLVDKFHTPQKLFAPSACFFCIYVGSKWGSWSLYQFINPHFLLLQCHMCNKGTANLPGLKKYEKQSPETATAISTLACWRYPRLHRKECQCCSKSLHPAVIQGPSKTSR